MTNLEAVLFDMDGTLVETESLWKKSEVLTMEHFGQAWTKADMRDATGGPFERVAQIMADRCGVSIDEISSVLDENIRSLFLNEEIAVQTGARELVSSVEAAGVPLALVSNSWRVLVDLILSRVGIQFETTVAGDEISRPKPDPLPYFTAAEMLNVNIKNCVVIEDSEPGILSGIASGAAVVALQTYFEIAPAPRLQIVDSLDELDVQDLERLVGSQS